MKKILYIFIISLVGFSCHKDDNKTVFPSTKENSLENEIARIEVLTYEGHLHGSSFHYNTGGKLFKRKYLLNFEKKNGAWQQVLSPNNADEINLQEKGIPMIGGNTSENFRNNTGNRYSFELHFFNKNGEDITQKIASQSRYYQVFFTTEHYHNLGDKSQTFPTKENGKKLINYVYRDTNPYNQMIGNQDVTLLKEHIGLKGYMAASKYGITYPITLSLFEWSTPEQKNNQDFYQLPQSGGKVIAQLTIPVDVVYFATETDAGIDEMNQKLAEYFGVSKEEYIQSEEDKPAHSMTGYFM